MRLFRQSLIKSGYSGGDDLKKPFRFNGLYFKTNFFNCPALCSGDAATALCLAVFRIRLADVGGAS